MSYLRNFELALSWRGTVPSACYISSGYINIYIQILFCFLMT